MNALVLLARVRALGGRMEARGERLHVEAPSPLPETLLQELREHKPALLSSLTPPPEEPIERIWWDCRRREVSLRLAELPDGGWTFIANPASAVTPELREALTRHRAEVLAEIILYNFCRAPGCQEETFIYALDGNQEAVSLCERHHDHCAAPVCDRAATFTSTRTGLLYCCLDHMDAFEGTR